MHPLKEDPIYGPCMEIIQNYELCNLSTVARFTNQCHDLYEQMSACMKQQRLAKRAVNFERSRERKQQRERTIQDFDLEWWKDRAAAAAATSATAGADGADGAAPTTSTTSSTPPTSTPAPTAKPEQNTRPYP